MNNKPLCLSILSGLFGEVQSQEAMKRYCQAREQAQQVLEKADLETLPAVIRDRVIDWGGLKEIN